MIAKKCRQTKIIYLLFKLCCIFSAQKHCKILLCYRSVITAFDLRPNSISLIKIPQSFVFRIFCHLGIRRIYAVSCFWYQLGWMPIGWINIDSRKIQESLRSDVGHGLFDVMSLFIYLRVDKTIEIFFNYFAATVSFWKSWSLEIRKTSFSFCKKRWLRFEQPLIL